MSDYRITRTVLYWHFETGPVQCCLALRAGRGGGGLEMCNATDSHPLPYYGAQPEPSIFRSCTNLKDFSQNLHHIMHV